MVNEDRKTIEDEAKQLSEMMKNYSYDKSISFLRQLVEKHPFSYFSIVKTERFKILWKDICEKTAFLDEFFKVKASTRIFYYVRKLTQIIKCETCGKPIEKDMTLMSEATHFFCCNRCAQLHESTIAKTKATKMKNHGDPNYNNIEKNKCTCKKRFGVEFAFQAPEVKRKTKMTLLENYGVDHQMKSQEVKDKMKANYRMNHGVDYAFQDPDVKAKINATNRANLGVDWPMQNKKLHKVMHEHSVLSQTTNFFNNKLSKDPMYEVLFTLDEWLEHKNDASYEYMWRCKRCGKEFKSRIMWGAATYVRCYSCYPVIKDTSSFEQDIAEYLRSLGKFEVLNHVHETKEIIPPKEVDIIVKDANGKILLGIEADGLYWHSAENQRGIDYHVDKTNACLSKGIQLVHVFEDEWTYKKDIVKSRIANLLGISNKRVYARECELAIVQSKVAKAFFDANHLQGACNAKMTLGLMHDNEFVAMMSFGKRRKITNGKNEDGLWELLRFACKCGTNVVGGASKLLKHFEESNSPKQLLSYADRRWSIGHLYEKLGFTLDHISKPNYWYLDSSFSKRIYRYAFAKYKQKSLLPKFDNTLTERQNMAENGYSWIWDCGNYVYVKTY